MGYDPSSQIRTNTWFRASSQAAITGGPPPSAASNITNFLSHIHCRYERQRAKAGAGRRGSSGPALRAKALSYVALGPVAITPRRNRKHLFPVLAGYMERVPSVLADAGEGTLSMRAFAG